MSDPVLDGTAEMAAVDGDHRTGHVTRRIGCQQQQRPVEVFQLAEPTLPLETFNYLALLATLGKLGRTENEVATHILVREVYAMHARGFHEMRIPPPSEDGGTA